MLQPKVSIFPTRSTALLVLFAGLILLERLHTYAEPLERDIAGYAVIAHEILHGRQLYSDLWERKPPLLYAVFAVAELAAGYGRSAIFLLNILAGMITLVGLYAAGRCWIPGRSGVRAGLLAAGFWVLTGGDLYLQANQPNTEVFLNACIVWAFVAVLEMMKSDWKRRTFLAIGAGLLMAAATLFKHHTILICAGMWGGYLICKPMTRQAFFHRASQIAISFGMIAVAWLCVIAYFLAVNRLGAFYDVLVRQNLEYVGHFWNSLVQFRQPFVGQGRFVIWVAAPLAVVLFWIIMLLARQKSPEYISGWFIVVGWTAGSWVTISIPGHFFPHYYQLAIPIVCISVAAASIELSASALRVSPIVRNVLIAGAFLITLIREFQFYLLPPQEWSTRKYGGDFIQQTELATRLNAMLQPGETFWNFGQDPTLYFETRKSPPVGYLYLDPLLPGPYSSANWRRLTLGLQAKPPDMIVVTLEQYWQAGTDAPLFTWIDSHYISLGVDRRYPAYLLLARRGSRIEKMFSPGRASPHLAHSVMTTYSN